MRSAALLAGAGACLLFLVQPMLARLLLPWFGGTPAVWTASMLFFQTALLAGYAWATFAAGRPAAHRALLALSLVALPITPDEAFRPTGAETPTLRLLGLLAVSVGLPFVALAATAPLVQAWRARTGDPSRLYAWSNAGSLSALAAYPSILEPLLGGVGQTRLWSLAYVAFVAAAWRFSARAEPAPAVDVAQPVETRSFLRWVAWSACGTVLLAATTEAVSQDLSVSSVLWVSPLAVYLLTWIVAFSRLGPSAGGRPRRLLGPALGVASLGVLALLHHGWRASWGLQLGGYLAVLFVLCLVCHVELAADRPAPAALPRFYLAIALGGALGGAIPAGVGPLLLPMHLELHLAVPATWLLYGAALLRRHRARPFAGSARGPLVLGVLWVAGLGAGLAAHAIARLGGALEVSRSFFGVLQVKTYGAGDELIVHLLDGRISHGFQLVAQPREPTAYFVRGSGIGQVLGAPGPARHVGVLGLGVGTMAAYGRPGDRFRFYEVNPDVVRVARSHFRFLSDTVAQVDVVPGDGRLSLAAEPPQAFDVLVLDAFSGDAIPTHLLTVEALGEYLRHLRPDGVLAVNVSNRHLDAARVVRGLAQHAGLHERRVRHQAGSVLGPYRSDWMLLARDPARLPPDRLRPEVEGLPLLWTDDHAPVWPLLR